MIDNVYELKQRFVGFNKVKLLTVVFYCMTYSWCSFLNEYNAMDANKDKWAVVDDAVVYKGEGFTLTYRWNNEFWISINLMPDNSIPFPKGYELAIRLVNFLYRHRDALGIKVYDEVEYIPIDDKDLPGCCISCRNGKYKNRNILDSVTYRLCDRIRCIGYNDSLKTQYERWLGNIGDVVFGVSHDIHKNRALYIIAHLFEQELVNNKLLPQLLLSDLVVASIKQNSVYEKVAFKDSMSLEGVIDVARVENNNKWNV